MRLFFARMGISRQRTDSQNRGKRMKEYIDNQIAKRRQMLDYAQSQNIRLDCGWR